MIANMICSSRRLCSVTQPIEAVISHMHKLCPCSLFYQRKYLVRHVHDAVEKHLGVMCYANTACAACCRSLLVPATPVVHKPHSDATCRIFL